MVDNTEIIFHGDTRFTSPWTLTVGTALKEKGIPFRVQNLDLQKGEHHGDYRHDTLAGKVPSLRHGEMWISESLAILEYLEEVFAPPKHAALLPKDAADRALDREILSWLRSDLFELRQCLPYEGLFLPMPAREVTAGARAEAAALVEVASKRAAKAAAPTLADFELAFTLRRLIHYRLGLEGREDLVRWSDAIWQRPTVQSWVRADRSAFGGKK
jgi:glutathione S-transferase